MIKTRCIKRILVLLFIILPTVSIAAKSSNLAQSYQLEAKGEYSKAAEKIKPLLEQKGDRAEFAHLRYAWLQYLQRKYNKAITHYKNALTLNPNSIDAMSGISLVMLAQLRWKEAALYANKILKKSPANYTASLRLMVSLSGQKKWQQLATLSQKVSKLYPTQASPLLYLARANVWSGNKTQAKQTYQSVLLRTPGNIEALNYLSSGN